MARAEEEFALKEAQLRTALESMSGGLLMTDSDLVVQVINDRVVEWCHYPQDVAQPGVSFSDFIGVRARRGDHGFDAPAGAPCHDT